MYELVILGQLMHMSAHGYLITKIINDIIGPYARVSPGRLYPLLAQLERDGLIEVDQAEQQGKRGDRHLRVYKITPMGRVRFMHLMLDTSSNLGDYQRVFALKTTAFSFMSPAERLRLINHYINYCETHVLHHQNEAESFLYAAVQNYPGYPRFDPESIEYTVNMIYHSVAQWELELDWAREMRDRELVRSVQQTPTPDADATSSPPTRE